MPKKALLICNGENNSSLLQKLSRETDFVLAADGGADAALAAGITPDAVIGDLDSVSPLARRRLDATPFIRVQRQDNTDLEKALDWLTEEGFKECVIAGAAGGRLDFTLGNFLAVRPYLEKINIRFQGAGWTLWPLLKGIHLPSGAGARLSLIPISPCRGITLKGVKFPVENVDWRSGEPSGLWLSNVIENPPAQITLESGFMLVYCEDYKTPEKTSANL